MGRKITFLGEKAQEMLWQQPALNLSVNLKKVEPCH